MKLFLLTITMLCAQAVIAQSPFILFEEINKVSQLGNGDLGIRGLITYTGGSDGLNTKLAQVGQPNSIKRLNGGVLLSPTPNADGKLSLYSVNLLNNCYKNAMIAMTNKKEFKFCLNAGDGSAITKLFKQDTADSSSGPVQHLIKFAAPYAVPGDASPFNCPIVPITASCE